MAGYRWDKLREAQHAAIFPPAERAERNRLAQRRYRERYATRLAAARRITSILLRRSYHDDDFPQLAAALRVLLLPEGIKALRRELSKPATKRSGRAKKGRGQ